MGSSLSGLTPKDTYQSLLKTTDNTACSTTLKTISDGSGNDTPLQLSTLRLGVLSDSSVTTQTSSVIQATTTNANLVLAPNGTGAIVANIPDGTATGGNARGNYAVDLQTSRSSAVQVASANYAIVIGQNCQADGTNSLAIGNNAYAQRTNAVAIGKGQANGTSSISIGINSSAQGTESIAIGGGSTFSNTAVGFASVVIGGNNNNTTVNGQYSGIFGGASNSASSNYSIVSGGQSNTASTGSHATVVGGSGNTASGQYSVAGGYNNNSSGTNSVAIGNSNIAGGLDSYCFGKSNSGNNNRTYLFGTGNTVGGFDSIAVGSNNSIGAGATSGHAFGIGNSITAGAAGVALGNGNVVTANTAVAVGYQAIANAVGSVSMSNGGKTDGSYSVSMGQASLAYLYSQVSHASGTMSGFNAERGTSQASNLVAFRSPTVLGSGATTLLSLDGSGTTNLIIPNGSNRAWNVQVNWVAVVTAITGTATGISVGDVVTSVDLLGFKRVGGTSSASVHTSAATKTMVTTPAQYAACAIAYTAGASQEMAMTFTGPTFVGGGSVTMRVVARVELSEVAW